MTFWQFGVRSLLSAAVLGAVACTAAPEPMAQPQSPQQPQSQPQSLALDLARHHPDSKHFEGRYRRSELISGGRAAEVSRDESLSVMGGEDGIWKDPRVSPSSVLAFTLGIKPREGALDLSMDPGPAGSNVMSFSVDNRLGRDMLFTPIMLRREENGTGVRATTGKPCRLTNGMILGQRLPAGVFAVVVPANTTPPPADAPRCDGDHEMFGD